jgi:hypothetical protein
MTRPALKQARPERDSMAERRRLNGGAERLSEPWAAFPTADRSDSNPAAYRTVTEQWQVWRCRPDGTAEAWLGRNLDEQTARAFMEQQEIKVPGTVFELRRVVITEEGWPVEVTNLGSQYAAREEAEAAVKKPEDLAAE